MCLIVKKGEVERTATEDMVVYKIIWSDNNSFHQHFQYNPNKLYRLRKKLKIEMGSIYEGFHSMGSIYEGFHSFASFLIARDNRPHFGRYKIVKFIIPKGAKYYLGMNGDIVSTSIRSGDLKS